MSFWHSLQGGAKVENSNELFLTNFSLTSSLDKKCHEHKVATTLSNFIAHNLGLNGCIFIVKI